MTFANPLPWWLLVVAIVSAVFVAWHAYSSFPGAPRRRLALSALRLVTFIVLLLALMRPVGRSADADARDAMVPILVDTSRSMSIEDVDGARRIDRARELLTSELLPELRGRFNTEILAFGEGLAPADPSALGASGRRSDLSGALAAVRERYRGRPVAGVVLISDGGETGRALPPESIPAPVYAFGVGAAAPDNDREVLSVTAAEAVLDESRVDLAVLAVSHGGDSAVEIRLLENGRPVEVRHVRPAARGGPFREIFHVAPPAGAPTVYSVEIPALSGELVPENNVRSILVQPPSRARRVLLVEGAPGFEHSFLKRALAADRGLELDSVVRKGVNEQGADTFYIQAARSRAAALENGFPSDPAALFAYDAVVLGNTSGAQLAGAQLEMVRNFVLRRGGGLLVFGAYAFQQKGLLGTPVEDALPVSLSHRGDSAVQASARPANRVALTDAGLAHPVMQLAAGSDETRKRWDAAPPLASAATLGAPRAGATVLATTSGAGGVTRALVAVQRFGEGRSMVFTGEASWRWRMLMPSSDRMYDTFWRQAIRWLAVGSSDPVSIAGVAPTAPGDDVELRIAVRDPSFAPMRDAAVDLRITGPDGRARDAAAALEDDGAGTPAFVATFTPPEPGIYKVHARVRRGGADAGTASTSFLAGGADVEMTDPRLNMPVLTRLAAATGGRVFASGQSGELAAVLRANVPGAALAVRRDLWHNGWWFAALLMLLAGEWILRRRWGLR